MSQKLCPITTNTQKKNDHDQHIKYPKHKDIVMIN